ncbi:ATP synthase subunit a [Clostridia bacterium]|nr:ATP synthase subunit a [Clostridia bacterium]
MENVVEAHTYLYWLVKGDGGTVGIPFITDAVVTTWIIMAVIMAATLLLTRKLELVPKGGQNAAEAIVDFIGGMAEGQIGHNYKRFVPYIGTVLIYLGISNMLAIFNIIPSGEALAYIFGNPELEHFHLALHPPTKNFNVTLCLAIMSMVVVIWAEFKYKGVRAWVRSFYKPTPISAFIKLLDYVVRPMSLCLRLFGNILGAYIVMELIYSAMKVAVIAPAAASAYFDLFDGGLQAYVFVFLTMVYIGESVEEVEEE